MFEIKTIKINGNDFMKPNTFSPQREDVYQAEITTCTGKTIADRVGWKYSDLSLEWDFLPETDVQKLLALSGEFTFQFEDADGVTHSEQCIRSSNVQSTSRVTRNGVAWWKDVKTGVRFLNAYN